MSGHLVEIGLSGFVPLLAATTGVGRWVFAGVFAVTVVWLLLIPRERIGQGAVAPPWWRNIRFWAVVAAVSQMMIYAVWG